MGSRRLIGTVVSFDEAVGLGDIETDRAGAAGEAGGAEAGGADRAVGAGGNAGAARFPFHCTQIADGTRTVAVGTRVSFGLLAGRVGRWEAAEIQTATE